MVIRLFLGILAATLTLAPLNAQSNGRLTGTVAMEGTGGPVHDASVLIVELGRTTLSDDDGKFSFARVPPGTYHVVAHLEQLFNDAAETVEVSAGEEASVEFLLSLATQRFELTVTASEKVETALEAFQDVESFDVFDLAESTAVSLGEALDHQVGSGIAKRSFGPGSARPIIRGFDGDRVLIMEDGIRTGTLSSSSGDHPEVINVGQIQRLEVVKGPATLLYSGNAMGGTVNAVSRQHERNWHPQTGVRGYLSGSGGTNNSLGGGNAGFEAGFGNLQIWGQGGGTRTGDYTAPEVGKIYNSRAQLVNGSGGIGWYGTKAFVSAEIRSDRGRNGVPFLEELHGHHDEDHEEEEGEEEEGEEEDHEEEAELDRVTLASQRQTYRVNTGLQNLGGPIESFVLKLSYVDWQHDELEYFEDGDSAIGTTFQNERFVYRGVFEQAKRGVLSGKFGIWGLERDFEAAGEEALAPPIDQSAFALFGLEELEFERFKLQFGARVETQKYIPAFTEREAEEHHGEEAEEEEEEEGEHHEEEIPDAVERTFTGASFAAGLHADLWSGGAFVANFARSYRAPALEELYNYGPHAGNLAFEVGDPNLEAEQGNGIDLSLRHAEGRVRAEFNFFYYGFNNFIFPYATGESRDELIEIEYSQRDARFTGTEANLDILLHPSFNLNLGLDYVDAKDTRTNTYLPRIPPLRGSVGVVLRRGGFSIAPTLVMASEQNRTFTAETPTPAYSVVNLKASYMFARRHTAHQFSFNVFNVGDRLYRNHSSFIKDLAPEIGRGVRFTYMMRFF